MDRLHALRQVTKPLTDAEVMAIVRLRYGNVRENFSSDDQVAERVAAELTQRKAKRKTDVTTKRPG